MGEFGCAWVAGADFCRSSTYANPSPTKGGAFVMDGINPKQGKIDKSPVAKALALHFEKVEKMERRKYDRLVEDDFVGNDTVMTESQKLNADYYVHNIEVLDGKDQGFAALDNPVK